MERWTAGVTGQRLTGSELRHSEGIQPSRHCTSQRSAACIVLDCAAYPIRTVLSLTIPESPTAAHLARTDQKDNLPDPNKYHTKNPEPNQVITSITKGIEYLVFGSPLKSNVLKVR